MHMYVHICQIVKLYSCMIANSEKQIIKSMLFDEYLVCRFLHCVEKTEQINYKQILVALFDEKLNLNSCLTLCTILN